jgi:lysophospholipase L1-like esterase
MEDSVSMLGLLGKRLALASASLLLALPLCEAALRLAGFRPLYVNEEQLVFWQHDPQLGWHHVPGRSGRFGKEDFDIEVRINARGLRDRDYPHTKPDGVARILVLGDSLVWGFGVEQGDIFTEVLERSLDGVEVINAGVSGFSTDQELIWLEERGFQYEPDLVLVVLTGNDIWGNQTSFAHGLYYKPRYLLDAHGGLTLAGSPAPEPPRLARLVQWLRRHSVLFDFVHVRLRQLPLIDTVRARLTGERRVGPAPPPQPPRDLTRALLAEIAKRSRERGADFLLLVTDDFWTEPSGSFEAFVAGLPTRGMRALLNREDTGYDRNTMNFAHDPHWNAAGHAHLAGRLAEVLALCRPGACGGR